MIMITTITMIKNVPPTTIVTVIIKSFESLCSSREILIGVELVHYIQLDMEEWLNINIFQGLFWFVYSFLVHIWIYFDCSRF